jgi:hypothetical protein
MTWAVRVSQRSLSILRTSTVQSRAARLGVAVFDTTGFALTGVPFANVMIRGMSFVTGETGLLRASVDSEGPCVVQVRALGWDVQPPDTVTLIRGRDQYMRHVMRGKRPMVKEGP